MKESGRTNVRSIDDADVLVEDVRGFYAAQARAAGAPPSFGEMLARKRGAWLRPAALAASVVFAVGVLMSEVIGWPDAEVAVPEAGLDAEFASVTRWEAPSDRFLGLPFQDYQSSVPVLSTDAATSLGGLNPRSNR